MLLKSKLTDPKIKRLVLVGNRVDEKSKNRLAILFELELLTKKPKSESFDRQIGKPDVMLRIDFKVFTIFSITQLERCKLIKKRRELYNGNP